MLRLYVKVLVRGLLGETQKWSGRLESVGPHVPNREGINLNVTLTHAAQLEQRLGPKRRAPRRAPRRRPPPRPRGAQKARKPRAASSSKKKKRPADEEVSGAAWQTLARVRTLRSVHGPPGKVSEDASGGGPRLSKKVFRTHFRPKLPAGVKRKQTVFWTEAGRPRGHAPELRLNDLSEFALSFMLAALLST